MLDIKTRETGKGGQGWDEDVDVDKDKDGPAGRKEGVHISHLTGKWKGIQLQGFHEENDLKVAVMQLRGCQRHEHQRRRESGENLEEVLLDSR